VVALPIKLKRLKLQKKIQTHQIQKRTRKKIRLKKKNKKKMKKKVKRKKRRKREEKESHLRWKMMVLRKMSLKKNEMDIFNFFCFLVNVNTLFIQFIEKLKIFK